MMPSARNTAPAWSASATPVGSGPVSGVPVCATDPPAPCAMMSTEAIVARGPFGPQPLADA